MTSDTASCYSPASHVARARARARWRKWASGVVGNTGGTAGPKERGHESPKWLTVRSPAEQQGWGPWVRAAGQVTCSRAGLSLRELPRKVRRAGLGQAGEEEGRVRGGPPTQRDTFRPGACVSQAPKTRTHGKVRSEHLPGRPRAGEGTGGNATGTWGGRGHKGFLEEAGLLLDPERCVGPQGVETGQAKGRLAQTPEQAQHAPRAGRASVTAVVESPVGWESHLKRARAGALS